MNELPPEVLIDRDQILPDSSQPRKVFDEEAIKALREDIKINGLKEPIDINPLLDGRSTKYLTIDGECRTKATENLEGYEQLPCRLYKYKSQRQIDKHRASKHFHRKDWNPADRAVWLKYYIETHKLRQQALAREFSVTHATISQWLAPTRDPAVLNALRTGDISFTQAMHLSRIDDAETRSEALLRAKKDEGEDKHKTETETKEIVKSLHSTPEIAQDTTTADIEHRQKGEESESEITDREALINQISEDLRERFTNDTKDFNLRDIERIVKLIEHGVVMHDAIRTVKLSQTETPEKTEKGEGELPVNDGEGGSTEEALLSPETDPIVSKAFERGGEKGAEDAVLEEADTSPDAMLRTQSPLPEEGVEVTPGSDPSPETEKKKEPQVCVKVGQVEEMLQKYVKIPPKTFLARFKTPSHKGNFKNRVEGIHLWSGELSDLMESDLNSDSLFVCEVLRKRKALMDILARPKHSIIESEREKFDDLMNELKTKIEQVAKRGG